MPTSNIHIYNCEIENKIQNKEHENNEDNSIGIENVKTLEILDGTRISSYYLHQPALTILQSTPSPPSPAPSLTLSENSLSSSLNAIPEQPEKPILLIEYPEKESKSPEELYIQNANTINRYKELYKRIETETSKIKYKSELLEKYKLSTKDRLTEKLIELSSTQNSLQSLRSKRVMEQIKQSSCGISMDNDNEPDAIGKIISMFSRKNAQINNLDKQIDKTIEKCKTIEDEISSIKNELKNKEDEIEQLTSSCEEYSNEISQLETQLLDSGLVIEQINNLLSERQTQTQDYKDHKDCIENDITNNSSNSSKIEDTKYISKSPEKATNKLNKFLARTFSHRSRDHSTVSSI